jgi:4-hydroxy-3-methylbut-2-enyl diphosphate reductase
LRELGAGDVREIDGRPENVTFSMPKELRLTPVE